MKNHYNPRFCGQFTVFQGKISITSDQCQKQASYLCI